MIRNFIRKQCPDCGKWYNVAITNNGDWEYTCYECGIKVEGYGIPKSEHIFQKMV